MKTVSGKDSAEAAASLDQLADYLNGHANEAASEQIEARLRIDPDLRETLRFEQHLQTAMREAPAQLLLWPEFSSWKERQSSRSSDWFRALPMRGALAAALVLAVGLVVVYTQPPPSASLYETLSEDIEQPVLAAGEALLRVAVQPGMEPAAVRALARTLELHIAASYPQAGVFDLRGAALGMDEAMTRLQHDARILHVSRVTEQSTVEGER